MYNGEDREILNEFYYVGIVYMINGNFLLCQKQLAHQGKTAMFAMRSKVESLYFVFCLTHMW